MTYIVLPRFFLVLSPRSRSFCLLDSRSAWRRISEKANTMVNSIHTSSILMYEVVGKFAEIPMKLERRYIKLESSTILTRRPGPGEQ